MIRYADHNLIIPDVVAMAPSIGIQVPTGGWFHGVILGREPWQHFDSMEEYNTCLKNQLKEIRPDGLSKCPVCGYWAFDGYECQDCGYGIREH